MIVEIHVVNPCSCLAGSKVFHLFLTFVHITDHVLMDLQNICVYVYMDIQAIVVKVRNKLYVVRNFKTVYFKTLVVNFKPDENYMMINYAKLVDKLCQTGSLKCME